MMTTALAGDEIIVAARFPKCGAYAYRQFSRRTGDFAIVAVAVAAFRKNIHVGVGGVEDKPLVFEFTEFIVNFDMKLSTNPAASAFYLLTGFHGTHVAIGVIMLLSLWGISRRRGGLSDRHGLNLELVGLYWHFVDIIWIFLFPLLYLIGRH